MVSLLLFVEVASYVIFSISLMMILTMIMMMTMMIMNLLLELVGRV